MVKNTVKHNTNTHTPRLTQARTWDRGPLHTLVLGLGLGLGLSVSAIGVAQAGNGRLLATGGVTQIEGSGGGGIVPWALISGLGTSDQIGGTAFMTHVSVPGYNLNSIGAAVGIDNRVEVSVAHQSLGVDLPDAKISSNISQDIIGIKVRVAGDAVFAQDSWLPQIAIGAQFKHNNNFDTPTSSTLGTLAGIPKALGARDASGIDYYVAATKVFLGGFFGRNLLLNGTVRMTKANQMGLLGFGGAHNDSYHTVGEASVGVFLDQGNHTLVGFEYRQNHNNGLSYVTSGLKQGDYKDAYIAYIPNKHFSLVTAYAQLGDLPLRHNETGPYLSIQATF